MGRYHIGAEVQVSGAGVCVIVKTYAKGRGKHGADVRDVFGCVFWVPFSRLSLAKGGMR